MCKRQTGKCQNQGDGRARQAQIQQGGQSKDLDAHAGSEGGVAMDSRLG